MEGSGLVEWHGEGREARPQAASPGWKWVVFLQSNGLYTSQRTLVLAKEMRH